MREPGWIEGGSTPQLAGEASGNSNRFHPEIKQRLGPNKQLKQSNGRGHMLQLRCRVRLIAAAQRLERLRKRFHVALENQPWKNQKMNESAQRHQQLMAHRRGKAPATRAAAGMAEHHTLKGEGRAPAPFSCWLRAAALLCWLPFRLIQASRAHCLTISCQLI